MSDHTPGPWQLKSWHEPQIVSRAGDLIAAVYADKNRKIIAAAPDLLVALQNIVDNGCGDHALVFARASIAKAQGRS